MRVSRVLIIKDGVDIDVTNEVRGGRIFVEGESYFVSWRQEEVAAAEELSEEVDRDLISFEAAQLLVQHAIMEGRAVPEPLRSWAANLVSGKVTKPKANGKLTDATRARDRLICNLVRELIEIFSIKPTSSDRARGQSACNAVATALSLMGFSPGSYDAIVAIWGKRSKLLGYSFSDD